MAVAAVFAFIVIIVLALVIIVLFIFLLLLLLLLLLLFYPATGHKAERSDCGNAAVASGGHHQPVHSTPNARNPRLSGVNAYV